MNPHVLLDFNVVYRTLLLTGLFSLVHSESELTSCSVQVLSPTGSPARYLLARLADRSCSLALLLSCLKKMDHQHAVQYLTAMGTQPLMP